MAAAEGSDGNANGPDGANETAAADAAARALKDLMARLPATRQRAEASAEPVGAPLRPNREYNGTVPAEPEAAEPVRAAAPVAAAETVAPPRPVIEVGRPAQPASPPLPRRRGAMSLGRMIWFVVAFVAPVLLGAIYLFFVMPDQYVTEFRFSVRVPVGNAGALSSLGQSSNGASVSALFGGNPTPGTDLLDNFTVADYARSAQAARDLNTKVNLKSLYSKPADPFSRLGADASQEKLGRYWKSMVYSDYDVTTGLAVVRVKAFSAQDSLSIANSLLGLSNQLVNDIGDQSQGDSLRFAKEQLTKAQDDVTTLRTAIAKLSARKGVDSPSVGVLAAMTNIATNTRGNIAELQGQIDVLMAQLHNPEAPQIKYLREQIEANKRALEGSIGVANATAVGQFADLRQQLTNALDVLSSAQAAYSYARATAAAQRLYLTTYVRPTLPESATAPDRLIDLLLVIVVAGMVWLLGMLVRNSIREHGL